MGIGIVDRLVSAVTGREAAPTRAELLENAKAAILNGTAQKFDDGLNGTAWHSGWNDDGMMEWSEPFHDELAAIYDQAAFELGRELP